MKNLYIQKFGCRTIFEKLLYLMVGMVSFSFLLGLIPLGETGAQEGSTFVIPPPIKDLPPEIRAPQLVPKVKNDKEFLAGEILVKYKKENLPIREITGRMRQFERRAERAGSQFGSLTFKEDISNLLRTQKSGIEELGRIVLTQSKGIATPLDPGDAEPPSVSLNTIAKPIDSFPLVGVQRIKVSSENSLDELITLLRKDPRVQSVVKNYRIYPTNHSSPPNDELWLNHFPPIATAGPAGNPLTLPKLWGLERIKMHLAWDDAKVWANNTTNQQEVIVAVIDSGIDTGHPDLQPVLWINKEEANGIAGKDDDENGKIDDVHGYNFRHSADVNECKNPQGKSDLSDEIGHGTHVAGVIAGFGNNHHSGNSSTGMVGINGNGHVKLMTLKIFCQGSQVQTSSSLSDAIGAIEYAYKNHAHVINSSWSLPQGLTPDDVIGLSEIIEEANINGILFVTAAGNHPLGGGADVGNIDLASERLYPANFPHENIVAVAASGIFDHLYPLSNWGAKSVHISAPGHYILSTYPRPISIAPESGTSMATPFVAGCAAFVQSQRIARGLPFLQPSDLRELLMKEGDKPEDPPGQPTLAGKVIDGKRLNCFATYQASIS